MRVHLLTYGRPRPPITFCPDSGDRRNAKFLVLFRKPRALLTVRRTERWRSRKRCRNESGRARRIRTIVVADRGGCHPAPRTFQLLPSHNSDKSFFLYSPHANPSIAERGQSRKRAWSRFRPRSRRGDEGARSYTVRRAGVTARGSAAGFTLKVGARRGGAREAPRDPASRVQRRDWTPGASGRTSRWARSPTVTDEENHECLLFLCSSSREISRIKSNSIITSRVYAIFSYKNSRSFRSKFFKGKSQTVKVSLFISSKSPFVRNIYRMWSLYV